jgi:hypothetical protein
VCKVFVIGSKGLVETQKAVMPILPKILWLCLTYTQNKVSNFYKIRLNGPSRRYFTEGGVVPAVVRIAAGVAGAYAAPGQNKKAARMRAAFSKINGW